MNRAVTIVALAWIVAVWCANMTVYAQGPGGPPYRTQPWQPGPTLSPYLDYFRRPLGPLDSYHEFVRPRRQVQQRLQQQDLQLRRQAQGLQSVQEQIARPQRPSGAAPTGTDAGFFRHSHFYPSLR